MLTQENIEDLIIEFIKEQHKLKLKELENERNEINEKKINLEKKLDKLIDFETNHLQELKEIYELPMRKRYSTDDDVRQFYLFHAINCIYNELECCKISLQEINDQKFCPEDFVQITYSDIENSLGISNATVKKYLMILEDKQRLIRKKAMGGFLFKIIGKE